MPYNPNRYSGKIREAEDLSQLMRDVNALEGFQADQTLSTTLTPQYGIIIGGGSTLTAPTHCAIDSDGNIYVTDTTRQKVIKYTAAGNYVTEWGTAGTAPGEFTAVIGLAIDSSDNVWVTDETREMIIKFDTDGNYVSEFASASYALHKAIDAPSDGYLYIGALSNVIKYNTSGTEQDNWSGFGQVTDLSMGPDGYIYVTHNALGVGIVTQLDPNSGTKTTVGSTGTGAGQFQFAQGVTVDAAGYIYITDNSRDKVIIYDSSLTYVTEFGTSGSSAGEFTNPWGICKNLAGDLLVADANRGKILRFTGVAGITYYDYENTYPTDAPYAAENCGYYGSYIFIRTGFNRVSRRDLTNTPQNSVVTQYPPVYSIAALSTGDVILGVLRPPYPNTPTVEIYSGGGTLQSAFSVSGDINTLCVDSSDNIYVSEYNGSSVRKYSTAGALLATYGTYSHSVVNQVCALSGGGFALHVGVQNKSIYVYNSSGVYVTSFATGEPDDQKSPPYKQYPVGISTGSTGYIYVMNTSTSRIMVFSTAGVKVSEYQIQHVYVNVQLLYGISPQSTYLFALTRGANNSAHCSVAKIALSTATSYSFLLEIPDGVSSTISSPVDVHVDGTHMFITDTGNNRVIKYTQDDGAYVSSFGSAGSGNGQFSSPRGIAKDSSGNIWVVDSGNSRVQKFNSSGTYQSQFGSSGSGNGQFSSPDRILIDSSDYIYITDKSNHRVQVFDSSGTFVRKFGSSGSDNGYLSSPIGIAKNLLTGHVYVGNSGNNRVEVFYEFDSSNAKYVSRWGSSGSGTTTRQFSSPEGMTADDYGHLWIVDTGNNRIARIASHGKLSTYYGSSGSGDGGFSSPSGIHSYQNQLFVVDRGNSRIHKFIITEVELPAASVQTEFQYYLAPSGERTMGPPDRGVHVPDIAALAFTPSADELGDNFGTNVRATKYMTDIRTAIERLSASNAFTDPDDGVLYDWSSGTSNLYKRALNGRHTLYGVSESAGADKRTWSRGALRRVTLTDLDIGEMYETVDRLKKATWGVVS